MTIYEAMEKIKAAARKSGLFIVVDSDLAFNQPTIQVDIDRNKANELGVTMQSIGDTLALMVGENYVNRFNLDGRSYQVIPQVPRGRPADPGDADAILRQLGVRPAGAAVEPDHGQDDDRAERADPLQPAQLGDVPGCADAGGDDGAGGRFSRTAGGVIAGRVQPRLPVRLPAIRHARATSSSSPSSSR